MDDKDRIARRLKLKDLHTFSTTVQLGSMAKAAQALALTQPAVSKVIHDMEDLLAVKLLERSAYGVSPTVYGEALLKSSKALLDDVSQAVAHLKFLADPSSGHLRIGTTSSLLAGVVPTIIHRLSTQYPRMAFHVTQAHGSEELFDALRSRRIDLSLSRIRPDGDEDLNKQILFDDPIVVITDRSNSRYRGRSVRLVQLVDEPWCMPHEDMLTGSFMRQAFRRLGIEPPRVSVSCASMQLQIALVEMGRYFTMVPASFLRFHSANQRFRQVRVPDLDISPPPMGIATLRARTASPLVGLFTACSRTVVEDLAGKRRLHSP